MKFVDGRFLSARPDRIWPYRMYAGKRGGGIAWD